MNQAREMGSGAHSFYTMVRKGHSSNWAETWKGWRSRSSLEIQEEELQKEGLAMQDYACLVAFRNSGCLE